MLDAASVFTWAEVCCEAAVAYCIMRISRFFMDSDTSRSGPIVCVVIGLPSTDVTVFPAAPARNTVTGSGEHYTGSPSAIEAQRFDKRKVPVGLPRHRYRHVVFRAFGAHHFPAQN
jgi:hypothetical protein